MTPALTAALDRNRALQARVEDLKARQEYRDAEQSYDYKMRLAAERDLKAALTRIWAMEGVLREYADGKFPNGDIVAVSVQAFARRALEAGK